jgi:AcrR family transcriptional regulator
MRAFAMISRPAYLPAKEWREVTVETVIALAAEQNPTDITTGAIAKRMGVTQGALFRHFPSKDAILQAVMEWVSERLLARVDKASSAATSPLAALEAAFMAHIDFISEHPGVPRMLFGELQRAEQTMAKRMAQALIQRYGERLGRLVAEGKDRGELMAALDEKAAVTLFIGTIQGLVMQALIAGDVARIRERAPAVFALFRRAIEAPK